jgi:hypothetical protein
MATTAEMRAALRANGHDVPERGRLDDKWRQLYQQENPGRPASTDADWDQPDDDDTIASPDDTEPSVPMQPERRPRTARTARAERRAQPAGQKAGRLLGALRGTQDAKTGAKRKPKPKPRISVEKFTSRTYGHIGKAVAALAPSTGRCIQAQAAMAGVLLEDVVQGTVVDRVLQPVAQAEAKLDKVFALVAPPLMVFALEQNNAAVLAGTRTPGDAMIRQAMIMPILRESLAIGLEVTEEYADQIAERLKANAARDAEVDKLIAMIFGQAEAEAEDVTEPEPEMAGASA